MLEMFWAWSGRIAALVGIIIAIPVFWTWWQVVFGERSRHRRWLVQVSREPGARPSALVIDLLPGRDISTCVQAYLAEAGIDLKIPEQRRATVTRERALNPNEMDALARDGLEAHARLLKTGTDVIHVFFAGPAVAAMMLGAHLRNGPRCLIYHYDQGRYRPYGPLEPLRGPLATGD